MNTKLFIIFILLLVVYWLRVKLKLVLGSVYLLKKGYEITTLSNKLTGLSLNS